MSEQISYYEMKLKYETDPWDLFEQLNREEPIVVVDARSKKAYIREHIPGAIHLPHREMNESSTAGLDREKTYVVYCDGIGCNASTKGSLNLSKLGFQVRELMGGLEWWKKDGFETSGSHAAEGKAAVCGC